MKTRTKKGANTSLENGESRNRKDDFMKIPDSIRYNGKEFKTVYLASLHDNGSALCGQINHEFSTIYINPDVQDQQNQCRTYWHELLHVLVEESDIRIDGAEEERIVDQFARGIYTILQDNVCKMYDIKE